MLWPWRGHHFSELTKLFDRFIVVGCRGRGTPDSVCGVCGECCARVTFTNSLYSLPVARAPCLPFLLLFPHKYFASLFSYSSMCFLFCYRLLFCRLYFDCCSAAARGSNWILLCSALRTRERMREEQITRHASFALIIETNCECLPSFCCSSF